MRPIVVGGEVCRDIAQSSKLEWLETNGTGAFAMGTVAGVNTRRYHALLVASLRPPVERYVTLSRLEETAAMGDRRFDLGVCQYPGFVGPRGYELIEEFRPEPCATWRYRLDAVALEKQIYLVEGRQAVVVRYRASEPVTLHVRPFLAYRDYHSMAHANDAIDGRARQEPGVVRFVPYQGLPGIEFRGAAAFREDRHWYHNIEYLEELDRGQDFREDQFTPGVFTLHLEAGVWTPFCASIDQTAASDPPASKRDPFLVRRADGQPTIIAGYPWFTDWGRDTMISLPGLLIAPKRLEEARELLEGFLEHMDKGVIPNRFSDAGETPEYNTADGTLWMFQAVRQWLSAGGDRAFLETFFPKAQEIVDWHRRGTWYGIGVDDRDGLLNAGVEGTQLTWMDAKVGDWVVTPRHGKAVEINALWHGALCLMAEWAAELGDSEVSGEYRAEADRVRASFRAKFWNASRQCLFDVVRDEGPDARLRPNQLFAVSLGFGLLETSQQQSVVRICERELLTPVGLRTLEPGDPAYRPHFTGSPLERDGAYHQGTVWPWLLGPYIDAYLAAFGKTPETLAYCRALVDEIEAQSAKRGCLGSIAEVYDADEPRRPRGCPAQAWSVGEMARVKAEHLSGATAAGVVR